MFKAIIGAPSWPLGVAHVKYAEDIVIQVLFSYFGGRRRSHEHTEALMDALDEKVLWVDYGVVSSIMVCHPAPSSLLCQ